MPVGLSLTGTPAAMKKRMTASSAAQPDSSDSDRPKKSSTKSTRLTPVWAATNRRGSFTEASLSPGAGPRPNGKKRYLPNFRLTGLKKPSSQALSSATRQLMK